MNEVTLAIERKTATLGRKFSLDIPYGKKTRLCFVLDGFIFRASTGWPITAIQYSDNTLQDNSFCDVQVIGFCNEPEALQAAMCQIQAFNFSIVPVFVNIHDCRDGKTLILNNTIGVRVILSDDPNLLTFWAGMNMAQRIYQNLGRAGLRMVFKSDVGVSGFIRNFNFDDFGEEFRELLAEEFPEYLLK